MAATTDASPFKNKIGAGLGFNGWSGECVRPIDDHFCECGIPPAAEGVLAKWQPDAAALESCRRLERTVGAAVKAG